MFYEIGTPHGLSHDPFKACIVPRPIGWISTVGADGVNNLAPYSFFNGIASDPPMVMYGSTGVHAHATPEAPKDTLANITATGCFVVNVATWDLRDAMNTSSLTAPPEVDEFALAGLTPAPSRLVRAPRIKEAPISLECLHHQTIDLPTTEPGGRNVLVLGRVVGIHIAEDVLTDGLIDIAKLRPIARLGYRDYACVAETFTMTRPAGGDRAAGNAT
ncbi:flavin reductase family protein [Novispirillum sp. DQ9]|uniref:flavin reductase family protein n=1 Tax=Novispirillum sp. DQ9 TaxID=3398612 RepID=UPI003C7AD32A